jgi:uroporphyrinogen-III synthase
VTAGPLAGRRIVVTRAARQSDGLRERLERQGAEVLLLPTIEIAPPESYAPLDDALRQARDFDWLVVTSANAVRVIGERLAELALSVESLVHLRCAAVGPSTADAMRELGLVVDVVPERYVGEALADALADRVRGQRVLLVRAAAARDVVPDALVVADASVTVIDAYRTVVPPDAVERLRLVRDCLRAKRLLQTAGPSLRSG